MKWNGEAYAPPAMSSRLRCSSSSTASSSSRSRSRPGSRSWPQSGRDPPSARPTDLAHQVVQVGPSPFQVPARATDVAGLAGPERRRRPRLGHPRDLGVRPPVAAVVPLHAGRAGCPGRPSRSRTRLSARGPSLHARTRAAARNSSRRAERHGSSGTCRGRSRAGRRCRGGSSTAPSAAHGMVEGPALGSPLRVVLHGDRRRESQSGRTYPVLVMPAGSEQVPRQEPLVALGRGDLDDRGRAGCSRRSSRGTACRAPTAGSEAKASRAPARRGTPGRSRRRAPRPARTCACSSCWIVIARLSRGTPSEVPPDPVADRETRPSSASRTIAAAVNCFVIDPMS